MRKLRCIRCGKEISNKKDILCNECKRYENIRKKENKEIRLVVCKECGRYKTKNEWKTPSNTYENIIEMIKKELNMHDVKEIKGYTYEGKDKKGMKTFVYLSFGICDECSRYHGGYYECIIQLRGKKEFIEKKGRELEDFISSSSMPRAFISKIVKVKGGEDYYLGSKNVGRKFINMQNKKEYIIKKSYIFYGVKDGKKITRDVFLIKEGKNGRKR